jgi:TRAP-type C4-dicarboxylate transport system substrate-binding protein
VVLVVSKRTWDKLSPEQQAALKKLGEEFSERGWEIGRRTDKEGIDRNREKGMEFIPVTPAMTAVAKDTLMRVVLPNWLKRAGPDGKPVFNQYPAPHTGITLP